MKERPILFSGPMVRALLDGSKTQTRRVVKPQPESRTGMNCTRLIFKDRKGNPLLDEALEATEPVIYRSLCPYGQPGARLWVRETWYCDDFRVQRGPYIKPDDMDVAAAREDGTLVYAADGLRPYEAEQPVWRPSIHMPRWASRITLEITGVRVERLQDISEADAIAEGCNPARHLRGDDDIAVNTAMRALENKVLCLRSDYPIARYAVLWESINGGGSWEENPYVWVVEFKRVQGGGV
jgi:hypothetical protein